MWVIYGFHLYFTLEIILAMARALFGLELEPQFDKPHLSTSVQNFWGRRWNLVVSQTLRSTVYEPALFISAQVLGRKWASLPAVMCTFAVSALMHEILFYYMGRLRPTWEVTWFFLLHGAWVVAEIWIKKVVKDRWRLPRLISTPMTVGFVMVSGFWLFIPQLFRCKFYVRAFEEYAVLGAFVKDVVADATSNLKKMKPMRGASLANQAAVCPRMRQDPPPKSPSNHEKSLKSQNRNQPSPLDQDGHNSQDPPPNCLNGGNPHPRITQKERTSIRNYAIKGVLVALLFRVYNYSDHVHPKAILVISGFLMYFMLEIILATAAFVARATLGLELEPQFDKPYLSTSLQDFWGRRWNLVVSRTLRPSVYDPVLCVSAQFMGQKWAQLPAVVCTFLVSALMHELIFYYMGRTRPTWEITWFFLLHGACLVVEIVIKKLAKDRYRLPWVIAMPLTVGFVMGTGFWLFIPQLLRCKVPARAFEEYALLGAFVKEVVAGGAVKLTIQ
ncbi:hypothetical protein RHSIM_Rhsim02G0097100 [Rhododendron simsii]|uniref:Wax synthase domain-containing protein n=1 Tax=Rhododendron simsii TaxID=118357 RepID=A0A834LUF6_RHOSS|nr:hypothetical protein RHSIM_Rhsim02G0097100 [Rhododendron simsii]